MKKLLCCCFVAFIGLNVQLASANQIVNSYNLTEADVAPAVFSGSLGWIRVQSGIIDTEDIDLNSIKIIDVHQDGNAAFIYCNFTHKQGKKFFGYIPLLRMKNSLTWINRDNGIILKK